MMVLMSSAGCATQPDIKNAIRVPTFREADRDRDYDIDSLIDSNARRRGLMFEYQAGDILQMSVEIEGNLAEIKEIQPLDIMLKRKFWIFTKGGSIWVSADGHKFQKIFRKSLFHKLFECIFSGESDAKKNKFTIGVGSSKKRQSNDLKIRLVVNTDDEHGMTNTGENKSTD